MTSATEFQQIVIRKIEDVAEIRAVEDLQIEVWGEDARDVVPLSQLVAAQHLGGSLIGAFDRNGMVGFVYGFLGSLHGRIVHHSHMLGVLPQYRNRNLAYRLKLAQRAKVLNDRVTDRITWTFDPLQSLNGHFNFAKLGVVADTYKINVYGESGASFLHRNGTDRFFVTWLINAERVKSRLAGKAADGEKSEHFSLLIRSNSGAPERPAEPIDLTSTDMISIEIPADINSIENEDFEMARKWRVATRSAFSEALAHGFLVTEYFRKDEQTGKYVLEKLSLEDIS